MADQGAFTIDEFQDLLPAVYMMDDDSKQIIFEFVREHCASRRGMMELLIVLAEMCAATMRRIHEREGVEWDFATLHFTSETTQEARIFGQVIAVTMNGDGDTQVALLRSLLDSAEDQDEGYAVVWVVAHCFGLFSFLLRELASSPPDSSTTTTGEK